MKVLSITTIDNLFKNRECKKKKMNNPQLSFQGDNKLVIEKMTKLVATKNYKFKDLQELFE